MTGDSLRRYEPPEAAISWPPVVSLSRLVNICVDASLPSMLSINFPWTTQHLWSDYVIIRIFSDSTIDHLSFKSNS